MQMATMEGGAMSYALAKKPAEVSELTQKSAAQSAQSVQLPD
jgi:hypothetical protein